MQIRDRSAESFGHDDDGNLTQDGTFNYTWDGENRLIEVVPVTPSNNAPSNKKVKFVYDYIGRRVRKAVYTYNNGWPENPGEVQHFVYDGWTLDTPRLAGRDGLQGSPGASPIAASQGWNVVMVLNGNASNAITRRCTWGLDLSGTIHGAGGIGGLLAVDDIAAEGSPSYWFFYDANGNVTQVLDATDLDDVVLTAHYEYDPYGNAIVIDDVDQSGYAFVNPIRFSTKWFDAETGLGNWGKRYFSPGLGRWISRDPIGEETSLNLYSAMSNSAVGRTDRLGLTDSGSWLSPDLIDDLLYKVGITAVCHNYLLEAIEEDKEVQRLLQVLQEGRCPHPRLACKCCGGMNAEAYFVPKTPENQKKRPDEIGRVYVCAEAFIKIYSGANNPSVAAHYMRTWLIHELSHACHDCLDPFPAARGPGALCPQAVCTEIRAVYASGEYDHPDSERTKQKIRDAAESSLIGRFNGYGPCRNRDLFSQVFNLYYGSCITRRSVCEKPKEPITRPQP